METICMQTASVERLKDLDGIGDARAQKLVRYREEGNPLDINSSENMTGVPA